MPINSHYITRGTGTPFIFQHGLGADCQQPQSLLKDLDNVQLISMDCRGHGETALSDTHQISFNDFANDIIELSGYLNIHQFIAGGISMGAGIALNIAIRYPEKVKALILVRPAWLNKPHPDNLHLLEVLADLISNKKEQSITQQKEFKELEAIEYNSAQAVLKQLDRKQPGHTALIFQKMVADHPFSDWEQLKNMRIPTLILASHHDFLHPYHYGTILQQNIPRSILREVPSRYLNNDLHENGVLSEVKNFLKQNQLIS